MKDSSNPIPHAWLRSILERYERPLLRYAARLTGDADRARDVVQETFIRLCAADRAGVEDHVAAWLFTVCRRRALDQRRKDSRMETLSETMAAACPSPAPGPFELVEGRQTASRVAEILAYLPANQQEAVRLKFQEQMSYRDIGEVMTLNANHVGVLLHKALKAIRQQLRADEQACSARRPQGACDANRCQ